MNDTNDYNSWLAYQQSKLGDILLAKEFHRRYSGYVRFFVVSVPRSIAGEGRIKFFKSPPQGASTTVMVATASDLVNGAYYRNCQADVPAESAKYEEDAKALFEYCDEVTKAYQ
jgi:hypothetical protein